MTPMCASTSAAKHKAVYI